MTDNDELVGRLARYIYGTQHNSRYQIEKVKKAMRLIRPGDTYNGMMWVPVGASPRMSGIDLAIRFSEHAAKNDGRLVITQNFRDLDRAAVLHLSPGQLSDIYAAMLQALKGDE